MKNGVPSSSLYEQLVPPVQLCDTIQFFVTSPFLSEDFLREKYLVQGLSTTQIAKAIGSASSTVLKYLRKFNIPVRKPSQSIRGKRKGFGLPYGKRIVKGELVNLKKEQEGIEKMKALREEGYSYWKIAAIFNSIKIPTQTGKGKWYARTIQQILEKN